MCSRSEIVWGQSWPSASWSNSYGRFVSRQLLVNIGRSLTRIGVARVKRIECLCFECLHMMDLWDPLSPSLIETKTHCIIYVRPTIWQYDGGSQRVARGNEVSLCKSIDGQAWVCFAIPLTGDGTCTVNGSCTAALQLICTVYTILWRMMLIDGFDVTRVDILSHHTMLSMIVIVWYHRGYWWWWSLPTHNNNNNISVWIHMC